MHEWIRFFRSRACTAGLLAFAAAATIYQVTERTRTVYIRDGQELTLAYTMSEEVSDILQAEGIRVMQSDIVSFTGFSANMAEVDIQHPISVTLKADGAVQTLEVPEGTTVGEVMESEHLSLDGNDKINMDTGDLLYDGATLVIERIDYNTRTEERELPYEILQTESSLLKPGRRTVLVSGQEGKEITTFSQKLQDGEVVFEQAVGNTLLAAPVAQEELVGAYAAISPLDFGYDCDDNGIPLDYVTVYRNQKATGYSARAGALTASGRYATPGHVAVNSEEIPYGTKLYIVSPDNTFIYGYAIAADTGTGLMDGRTDIDLFYDSYTESVLNGVRYVDVYVLE